jgi:hypothetical protein
MFCLALLATSAAAKASLGVLRSFCMRVRRRRFQKRVGVLLPGR